MICDRVDPELRPLGGDYPDMFRVLLPGNEWTLYDAVSGVFPADPGECDAYVCTGSRFSVYDPEPWIQPLTTFVRTLYENDRPYVGICFGHQVLGAAMGVPVAKSEGGWCVGVHTFRVNEQQAWMRPTAQRFNLLMSCQDQVQSLPADSILLAGNEGCPIGAFQVGSRMLGVQGHPEFPPAYAAALMDRRAERIGADKVRAARQSLSLPIDGLLWGEWIVRFLAG
ncbi:MAG: hypothetical protein RLY31_724 [Bacteroidota bacterium]|jgi:GMP synthase-like glutamine amidotransferase